MTEPVVERAEVVQALFALHDILVEVRRIRRLLEDDGEELEEDLDE